MRRGSIGETVWAGTANVRGLVLFEMVVGMMEMG